MMVSVDSLDLISSMQSMHAFGTFYGDIFEEDPKTIYG